MEWQPIETAPVPAERWYSSDMILVWNGERVMPCVISNHAPDIVFYDYSDCDRDGGYDPVFPSPTHWMPLPPPPVHP